MLSTDCWLYSQNKTLLSNNSFNCGSLQKYEKFVETFVVFTQGNTIYGMQIEEL